MRSVDQKCCSEMSNTSLARKYLLEASVVQVLLGSVDQKRRSTMSIRSVDHMVAQTCSAVQSELLLRSVTQKCQSAVLIRSVGQDLFLISVAQRCRSNMCVCVEASLGSSLRSVAQKCC